MAATGSFRVSGVPAEPAQGIDLVATPCVGGVSQAVEPP